MAGKNLPYILVVMMMTGMCIGGTNTTGVAQLATSVGLSASMFGISGAVGVLTLGLVGAKKMRAMDYSTTAEMVHDYCGSTSRYLMVVGQLVIILGIACLQYVAGGAMLSSMFPGVISNEVGIAITAVAFFTICLVGGLYGTSLANFINVIVIYIALIACFIAALISIGGWNELVTQVNNLPQSTVNGGSWFSLTDGLGLATALSFVISEPGNRITTQANTQCAFAAKDPSTAKRGIITAAVLIVPISLISASFGLIAKIQFPDIISAQAMPTVIMSLHPILAGFGMAGLWAVNISTGVALLMSSVQLVYYDVLNPLLNKQSTSKETLGEQVHIKGDKSQSRLILFVLLVLTLFAAYYMTEMVSVAIKILAITPAYFCIMLSILYKPDLLKKHSATITQLVAYAFFFLWLISPDVKTLIPNPIYVEWPLCIITFLSCYIFGENQENPMIEERIRNQAS
nr:sodium:solute symporter family protein [Alkalibacter mobilis]